MKQARHSRTSAPRVFAAVASLAILGAIAGCTMVGDSLTGDVFESLVGASCVGAQQDARFGVVILIAILADGLARRARRRVEVILVESGDGIGGLLAELLH